MTLNLLLLLISPRIFLFFFCLNSVVSGERVSEPHLDAGRTDAVSLAPDPKQDVCTPSLGQEILFHQELINPIKLPLISFPGASFLFPLFFIFSIARIAGRFYEFALRRQVSVKRHLSIQVIGIMSEYSLPETLTLDLLPVLQFLGETGSMHSLKGDVSSHTY